MNDYGFWNEAHYDYEPNYDVEKPSVYERIIDAIYKRGKEAAREYPTPECPYVRTDYVQAWELGLFNAQQHFGYILTPRADIDNDIPF